MKQHSNQLKYFLYARKSTDSEDRQVASIESQLENMRKDAEREGLAIIDVLSEARTAKVPGRPVFNEMLQRIRRGEAQGIVCWKLDRLARNPVDAGQISWMLQQGLIKHIRTHERDYQPSDNVLMMSVEFGMANQYIRDLSESVKRGLGDKAKAGWYPGQPRLGYLNDRTSPKGLKKILKDPDRFELMRKLFDSMATGAYSVPRLLKIATDDWGLRSRRGTKLSLSNLYEIFRDPFYYGVFEYPKGSGKWYQGKHEPITTPDVYDRIQALLGGKGRLRPKLHNFAFIGIMKCGGCGAAVTAEKKFKYPKNGKTYRYVYYHCTKKKNPDCRERSIEEKALLKQILRIVNSLAIPEEFHHYALKWFQREFGKDLGAIEDARRARQAMIDTCDRKLDKLIDMSAAEQITEDEFKRKREEILKEKARYSLPAATDADDFRTAQEMLAFLGYVMERLKTGNEDERRELLLALGSNHTLQAKNLFVELQKPLVPMRRAASVVRRIHRRLEPVKNGLTQRNLEAIYERIPVVSALLEDVRTALRKMSFKSWFSKRRFMKMGFADAVS